MNTRQKLVLWMGVLVAVAMFLYPPWQTRAGSASKDDGYALLFVGPVDYSSVELWEWQREEILQREEPTQQTQQREEPAERTQRVFRVNGVVYEVTGDIPCSQRELEQAIAEGRIRALPDEVAQAFEPDTSATTPCLKLGSLSGEQIRQVVNRLMASAQVPKQEALERLGERPEPRRLLNSDLNYRRLLAQWLLVAIVTGAALQSFRDGTGSKG